MREVRGTPIQIPRNDAHNALTNCRYISAMDVRDGVRCAQVGDQRVRPQSIPCPLARRGEGVQGTRTHKPPNIIGLFFFSEKLRQGCFMALFPDHHQPSCCPVVVAPFGISPMGDS